MITRRVTRPLSALSSGNWICPTCSRTSPIIKQHLPSTQRRRIHRIPALASYDELFKRDGIPGLFSRTGFQIAWTTYQGMIIRKLNDLCAGEEFEHNEPKDIALTFARDPMNASLFNHASMAFNNHFFFQGLSTSPRPLDAAPQMRESLEETFGSIDTLRATMLDTAAAMFGPGFVWLVWARNRGSLNVRNGEWRILTTYLAGTPFPEAGFRHQGLDMNTTDRSAHNAYLQAEPANTVGSFGPGSKTGREERKVPPGGTRLMPVLCVNTWEHVYIYDFGLPGKRKFLSDWWEAVDWSMVQSRTPAEAFNRFASAARGPYGN